MIELQSQFKKKKNAFDLELTKLEENKRLFSSLYEALGTCLRP